MNLEYAPIFTSVQFSSSANYFKHLKKIYQQIKEKYDFEGMEIGEDLIKFGNASPFAGCSFVESAFYLVLDYDNEAVTNKAIQDFIEFTDYLKHTEEPTLKTFELVYRFIDDTKEIINNIININDNSLFEDIVESNLIFNLEKMNNSIEIEVRIKGSKLILFRINNDQTLSRSEEIGEFLKDKREFLSSEIVEKFLP
ncbi:hypothetical protein [Brevibacillus laterosporus]|uniref:hypothetical protein n=1 Tax=Brevibacillus laterosporus TaxID=1465 RepID=UPI001443AC93|nr:hypothetical protein [Brevibacillus laterosporus]NKQ20703.1 hypothetical protein [Brevibacillus laterosporus]WNX29688.1 hypothetical protein RWW94_15805 [Brevibacillus laterosporus]